MHAYWEAWEMLRHLLLNGISPLLILFGFLVKYQRYAAVGTQPEQYCGKKEHAVECSYKSGRIAGSDDQGDLRKVLIA